MTTFVLVHGAWHGGWAWERVVPRLRAAGADVVVPELTLDRDVGLDDHVEELVAVLDSSPPPAAGGETVLVGHSYAGLVVRQAADRRPERVDRIVMVDGWAGPDGASLLGLAPDWFADWIDQTVTGSGGGWQIPVPPPSAFGIDDPETGEWLSQRLHPQPVRTFTESTHLTGAVDAIPGTGIHCRPEAFPFARLAGDLGYRLVAMDRPHDVMLADPAGLADELLAAASTG